MGIIALALSKNRRSRAPCASSLSHPLTLSASQQRVRTKQWRLCPSVQLGAHLGSEGAGKSLPPFPAIGGPPATLSWSSSGLRPPREPRLPPGPCEGSPASCPHRVSALEPLGSKRDGGGRHGRDGESGHRTLLVSPSRPSTARRASPFQLGRLRAHRFGGVGLGGDGMGRCARFEGRACCGRMPRAVHHAGFIGSA